MSQAPDIVRADAPGFAECFAARCRRNAVQIGGEPLVAQILEDVRRRGDEALIYWTTKLDQVALRTSDLVVVPHRASIDKLDTELRTALELAAARIRAYHERLLPSSWFEQTEPGIRLGSRVTAMGRVGIYVPGGKACYPSSILMGAIPAKVAGVKEVMMATPPRGRHLPLVIEAAAALAGVDKILLAGGAQAVAALAFGTATVPKVDKIVGPGNRYVAEAKRAVFGVVDIDSVAGPSEVLIIADGSAPAAWCAADAIAQAEHDEAAAALVLTVDEAYAQEVAAAIDRELVTNERREIAAASLRQNGLIVVCRDLEEAATLANEFAPEHLELLVRDPGALAARIDNAGAIFLGPHTPEAIGDYIAGPNHVLPTQGTARFFGPLSTEDFIKRTSLLEFDGGALDRLAAAAERLATEEGLPGHARSVRIRRP